MKELTTMKNPNLNFVIVLLLAIGVAACSTNNVEQGESIFEGYYAGGGELSYFEPCEGDPNSGNKNGYWLESKRDTGFGEQYYALTVDDPPDGFGKGRVYVRFVGKLSPTRPGEGNGYGHLGSYKNQVTVSELLDMSLDDKCPEN